MSTRLKFLVLLLGTAAIGIIAAFTMSIASYEAPRTLAPVAAPASTYEGPQRLASEANLRLQEDLNTVGGAAPTTTAPVSPYVGTPYAQAPVLEPLQEPAQPVQPVHPAEPAQAAPPATSPEPVYPAAADAVPATTAATATAVDTVTPGAWCARASAGTTGYSKNGVLMTCTYADGEDVPRWRA